MPSIDQIRASDGTSNANVATVQNSRAAASSTIVVDTVLGIPPFFMGSMGTPHTFIDPVTSEEITVISEATAVDFAGHVDGSDLEIDTIAPGYTDAGSEVGDIVIIRPTTQWGDNVADVLEESHEDDGTLNAGALGQIYPVGSIYINASNNTNPGTLLGFGTWVAFGAGRVPVGIDAGQTEFDTIGETGGAKTHTLTTAEMPAHSHTAGDGSGYVVGGATGSAASIAQTGAAFKTAAGNDTGGGGAHNNLQPYIVVYMWKRTV